VTQVDLEGEKGAVPADRVNALTATGRTGEPIVRMLPPFDPYVVASTRQLDSIGAAGHKADVSRPQGRISPTLVVDGWIRGVWEQADGGRPTVTPFAPLPAAVRRQLR
jgi:hypothetical protein